MDSDLLSQLLFRAKKEDKNVKLSSIDSYNYIIDPNIDWNIQSDSFVTDKVVIDLNTVVRAMLIEK